MANDFDLAKTAAAITAILGGIGGVYAIWANLKRDTGSTLAKAEQDFRDDLQKTLERQSARIAGLEKDNQVNYEQIATLAKKNTLLEIEGINKDEKITKQAQEIATVKQDNILLREEIGAFKIQLAELKQDSTTLLKENVTLRAQVAKLQERIEQMQGGK